MAKDIRERARDLLDQLVPSSTPVINSKLNGAKFTDITGQTHEDLITAWRKQEKKKAKDRAIVTSCNSFAGEYTRKIYGAFLGAFQLEAYVKSLKKGYAWVAATPGGAKPKDGDIVSHNPGHMGISYTFKGDVWHTVEGGQGGPQYTKDDETGVLIEGQSSDNVKRLERTYDPAKIIGWVDLELFVGAAASAPATPRTPATNGANGFFWLDEDDELIHPHAPAGRGGPGKFRSAGTLYTDPFTHGLPHPWSPAARKLDPLAVQEFQDDGDEA